MKRFLTIASIVTIMASSITVHAADANYINPKMHYENLYPKTAIVVDIDEKTDTITVFDGYYDWKFTGIEDWQMYDTVSMIMDNNGTKTVTDDKIVCEQASSIDLYNN